MKDKAEGEFDELRKADGNAKHNVTIAKPPLDDQIYSKTVTSNKLMTIRVSQQQCASPRWAALSHFGGHEGQCRERV